MSINIINSLARDFVWNKLLQSSDQQLGASCNQFEIGTRFGGNLFFLGGGFKYFLFSPLHGEMIQFD